MAEDKVHVGDIGTLIEVDMNESLADVDDQELRVQKPDGSTIVWAGTIVGQTITYTTLAGDIDMPGRWIIQPYVVIGGGLAWTGLGDSVEMEVYPKYSRD